jgi:glycosyltransferase involved in cell wall biosynthesis
MRIAFITLGFAPLRTSGLDVSGERLVKGLLSQGHQVTVIAGSRGDALEKLLHPNLNITRLPLGKTDWIGFGVQASQALRRSGSFDVVHFWDVHFGYAYRGKYLASLQHSFHQRLLSLGDIPSNNPFPWLKKMAYYHLSRRLAERPAIQHASGFLAGSRTSMQEFTEHYGIPPDRICLARHGVDVSFFKPSADTGQLRSQLGLSGKEPVLLFAGFMTPRKGLEYLAAAMPQIHPPAKLVLVGTWRNEAYRTEIMQLLAPVSQRVIEAGFVPDEQMPAYYSLADVYVSPSLLEGFGLPIAEALACQTPVVAAEAGAVAEVTGPGGLLVPPREPDALASAVNELLQDTVRRKELGRLGREYIAGELSLDRMVKDTLRGYEHFLL